jgi:hypothetical protein
MSGAAAEKWRRCAIMIDQAALPGVELRRQYLTGGTSNLSPASTNREIALTSWFMGETAVNVL